MPGENTPKHFQILSTTDFKKMAKRVLNKHDQIIQLAVISSGGTVGL